jgi:hypothetical protein
MRRSLSESAAAIMRALALIFERKNFPRQRDNVRLRTAMKGCVVYACRQFQYIPILMHCGRGPNWRRSQWLFSERTPSVRWFQMLSALQNANHHEHELARYPSFLCPPRCMACVGRIVFRSRRGEHPLAHVPSIGVGAGRFQGHGVAIGAGVTASAHLSDFLLRWQTLVCATWHRR